MAHYAKVRDGVVVDVIVADADYFNDFIDNTAGTWIQTSYNTYKGQHANGGTPLRKNFAGIGFTYDESRDAFIPPKPHDTWTLNETTCHWEAPITYPTDGKLYEWSDDTDNWVEMA